MRIFTGISVFCVVFLCFRILMITFITVLLSILKKENSSSSSDEKMWGDYDTWMFPEFQKSRMISDILVKCIINLREKEKNKIRKKKSFRSSLCSVRKGVLRNITKFTGKHLCQSLFFSKITSFSQNTSGRLLLIL